MFKGPNYAVVTGCSTGIGEAIAKRLAQDGWVVFAGVRKEADANRLRESHENIRPLFLDVTNSEQIGKAFEEVRQAVGANGLDALVNNAGLAYTGPSEFMPINDFRRQFDVNFFGLAQVTANALPLLRKGKPGRIANIGSIADEMNGPFGGGYCASKAAVSSYSECLRRELSKWNIKVTLIRPGPVASSFNVQAKGHIQDSLKDYKEGTPADEYYGEVLRKLPKNIEVFDKQAAPPSKCANVVLGFLKSSSPKNLYYDTWGTYWMMCTIRWLPTWLYDYLMQNLFFK